MLLWWFSTGAVLYAVNRPRGEHTRVLVISTLLMVFGLASLYCISDSKITVTSAYLGFVSALAVWAWHEVTFLFGIITGPNKMPSVQLAGRPAPLMKAISTVIYHEVALALTMAAIVALTWGGENQTGTWTFLVLWLMRLSAKINVYLGVPNITDEFMPKHLQYLKTYFCHRPMNLFFPAVITVATITTAALAILALHPSRSDGQAVAESLVAALLALAVIEHWFLVIPFKSAQLWAWAPDDSADDPSSILSSNIMSSNIITGRNLPAAVTRGVA